MSAGGRGGVCWWAGWCLSRSVLRHKHKCTHPHYAVWFEGWACLPYWAHFSTSSHPHLTSTAPHTLTSSHPHFPTPSPTHIRTSLHPHLLTPSPPHTLTSPHPHLLTSTLPHTLTYSPHSHVKLPASSTPPPPPPPRPHEGTTPGGDGGHLACYSFAHSAPHHH